MSDRRTRTITSEVVNIDESDVGELNGPGSREGGSPDLESNLDRKLWEEGELVACSIENAGRRIHLGRFR